MSKTLTSAVSAALLLTAPALAGERVAGQRASQSRDIPAARTEFPQATPQMREVANFGGDRMNISSMDKEKARKTLLLVGHKRDGTEVRFSPPETVVDRFFE